MGRGCSFRRAGLLGAALALLAGACTKENPAYRGPGDGPTVGPDDGGRLDVGTGDTGPGPAEDAGPGDCLTAPNGTPCGTGMVCLDGSCTPCAAGATCADPVSEGREGTIACGTGEPVCGDFRPAPNGRSCRDSAGVCYQGECNLGVCGGPDGLECLDPQAVCDLNGCAPDRRGACVTAPAGCTPTPPPVCGCDGNTYESDCYRLQAGVALDHVGPCTLGAEDCLNGVDDNGDGLADCQDPQCQADYTCAAPPPSGWTGVGWIDPDGLTSCPAELAVALDLFDAADIVAEPAQCDCDCDAPAGGTCESDLVCYRSNTACTGMSDTYPVTLAPPCQAATFAQMTLRCTASVPLPQGGACTAVASMIPPPAYSWPAAGRACLRPAGGSCGPGTAQCVPRPPSGSFLGPCLARAGSFSCPAPYTMTPVPLFDGSASDGRSCSACACGAEQGARCDCVGGPCVIGIHNSACTTGYGMVPADGATCSAVFVNGPLNVGLFLARTQLRPGACEPSPSLPTGGVQPTGPITVCCMP
ncbi:MAG: hypothetical protein HY906_05250 [Deltaproteobacteria bacterium]|nr:hypothetical protein [Deltaproteobacteria bacterium]